MENQRNSTPCRHANHLLNHEAIAFLIPHFQPYPVNEHNILPNPVPQRIRENENWDTSN